MRPTDQLVQLACQGQRAAIEALVDRYQHAAVMAAWAILSDFHLAEDVAQESFAVAFEQLTKLRSGRAFGPWFLTIVRRSAVRRRSRQNPEIQGVDFANLAGDLSNWESEFADILPTLARLPEQELDVVSLRYIHDLPVKQIAIELERPVGTVTKQLSRALIRLRELLAEADL